MTYRPEHDTRLCTAPATTRAELRRARFQLWKERHPHLCRLGRGVPRVLAVYAGTTTAVALLAGATYLLSLLGPAAWLVLGALAAVVVFLLSAYSVGDTE